MFVNLPIGAAAVILSKKYLMESGGTAMIKHLDLPGAVTITAGIILFVFSLTIAAIEGFGSILFTLPLVVSTILLAVFIFIENGSKAPLMPLGFLRRGSILIANVLALVLTISAGGLGFIVTVYLQQILHYSP